MNTLTVKEAAKKLHKRDSFIRWGLQQNRLPFGTAVQKPDGKWSYYISKAKVDEFIGKEMDKNEEK